MDKGITTAIVIRDDRVDAQSWPGAVGLAGHRACLRSRLLPQSFEVLIVGVAINSIVRDQIDRQEVEPAVGGQEEAGEIGAHAVRHILHGLDAIHPDQRDD